MSQRQTVGVGALFLTSRFGFKSFNNYCSCKAITYLPRSLCPQATCRPVASFDICTTVDLPFLFAVFTPSRSQQSPTSSNLPIAPALVPAPASADSRFSCDWHPNTAHDIRTRSITKEERAF